MQKKKKGGQTFSPSKTSTLCSNCFFSLSSVSARFSSALNWSFSFLTSSCKDSTLLPAWNQTQNEIKQQLSDLGRNDIYWTKVGNNHGVAPFPYIHVPACTLGSRVPQQMKWWPSKITCSSDFTLLSSSWCFSVSCASCSLIRLHEGYSKVFGWVWCGVVANRGYVKVTAIRHREECKAYCLKL